MAPEETSTTSRPPPGAASVSTSPWIRPGSMPPRVGQRRRADLDHDPVRPGDLRPRDVPRRLRRSARRRSQSSPSSSASSSGDRPCPSPAGGSRPDAPRETLVLAATAEDLRTDVDLGAEVEDDRVRATDGDAVSGLRAKLQQLVLDADPVQPVGQIADRLGVAEVRLPDPALGLVALDPPELVLAPDGELVRARPEWGAGRSGPAGASAGLPAAGRRSRPLRSSAPADPSPVLVEIPNTCRPRASSSATADLGELSARPACRPCSGRPAGAGPPARRGRPARPRSRPGRSPGHDPARRWRSRSRARSPRSARCGAGSRGRVPGPRWRPRSDRVRPRRCR